MFFLMLAGMRESYLRSNDRHISEQITQSLYLKYSEIRKTRLLTCLKKPNVQIVGYN